MKISYQCDVNSSRFVNKNPENKSVIYLSCLAMEDRAAERSRLKAERDEKRRKAEEEKLALLAAKAEEARAKEEEEKQRKAEEYREKKRLDRQVLRKDI